MATPSNMTYHAAYAFMICSSPRQTSLANSTGTNPAYSPTNFHTQANPNPFSGVLGGAGRSDRRSVVNPVAEDNRASCKPQAGKHVPGLTITATGSADEERTRPVMWSAIRVVSAPRQRRAKNDRSPAQTLRSGCGSDESACLPSDVGHRAIARCPDKALNCGCASSATAPRLHGVRPSRQPTRSAAGLQAPSRGGRRTKSLSALRLPMPARSRSRPPHRTE